MIIYFEGPDGSGKSTLLNTIYNDLINKGYKVDPQANRFIPTHPKAEYRVSERQLFRQLKRMSEDDSKVYLIDRGPISDIIYRVFDDYKPVTTPARVASFISAHMFNTVTIYCRTDLAEQKMLERGDDNPIAIQRHKEITKLYDLFMNGVICPDIQFDLLRMDAFRVCHAHISRSTRDCIRILPELSSVRFLPSVLVLPWPGVPFYPVLPKHRWSSGETLPESTQKTKNILP